MKQTHPDRPGALIFLIAVQALCAGFFLWDVLEDTRPDGLRALINLHIAIEALAAFGLIVAVVFETRYLMRLLRRKAHLEQQVSVAAGAFHDIMQAHFRTWGLTPAEEDVATFTIKGFSIAEIAAIRGAAQGTVKSQLNAIYRKAGVTGRGGLLSVLIDDLLNAPLMPSDIKPRQQPA
ncbi:helix-turn-helix domain-containing protein [Roseovarius gahaiensis]|uniref:Helix-turn-helix domain-containing protein n=1 Tax=Roseovarius gahaiensis TaxID=2716691 RepID=A0A967BAC2_9RHOB|nr:LuxR C-terminal-related transcriptional regulator [Roseovarius gahaiensis]NHQ72970.1 helix-turn-helix domain-containing protein [Roseovarius gahaiensis]